jgi:membrane protein DedA with SNARE-associated domain
MNLLGSFIPHVVATWGDAVVFVMLALEGLGLFFIPGETTLIAAAILAGATHELSIAGVLLAGWAGALTGDNSAWWVGQRYGFGVIRRYGHWVRMDEGRLKFVQYLYLRYGVPIVFVGRFITVLRCWEAFLAGANAMAWRRFAPVNALASLVWVGFWGLTAYRLGHASGPVLKTVGLVVLVVVGAALVLGWLYFRRHEPDLRAKADRALPGPLRPRRPQEVRAAAVRS